MMTLNTLLKLKKSGIILGVLTAVIMLCGIQSHGRHLSNMSDTDPLDKLRTKVSQFNILLMQGGEYLSEKEKEKVEPQLSELKEKYGLFLERLNEVKNLKIIEESEASDPKVKLKLTEEVEKINKAIEAAELAYTAITQALENLQTLTRDLVILTLEIVKDAAAISQEITRAISGTARTLLEESLSILKTAIQTATEALRSIVGLLVDILKFTAGALKEIGGIFGLDNKVDLSVEGLHSLSFGQDSYLEIYLSKLVDSSITVPFSNLEFNVISTATSVPDYYYLEVVGNSFQGTLEPFTAGARNISASSFTLESGIIWLGFYDHQSQSIYLALGGNIINDYSTADWPMIYSVIISGNPNGTIQVNGTAMEPFYLLPSLTTYGLIILAVILAAAGVWMVHRKRQHNVIAI